MKVLVCLVAQRRPRSCVVKYNGGQACGSGDADQDVAAGNWRMSVTRTNYTGTYRIAMQQ